MQAHLTSEAVKKSRNTAQMHRSSGVFMARTELFAAALPRYS